MGGFLDFLVPILKIIRNVIASFAGTLNTNIYFGINVNIIYAVSVGAIVAMIVYYSIKYMDIVAHKKKLVYRLFTAVLVSLAFTGLVGKLVSSSMIGEIHIKPIEGFIYDEKLEGEDLGKKLAFYGINAKKNDIRTISFKDIREDEDYVLHYALYKLDVSIKLGKKTEYKLLCVKEGSKSDGGDYKEGNILLEQDTELNNINITISNEDKEEESTIKGKKILFGLYEVMGEDVLEKILEKEGCVTELYIAQIGNNIFTTPFLIYRMGIDKTVLNSVKSDFSVPYIYFLLDDRMKRYFIYHGLGYYKLTFDDKSLLLYFLNNTNWDSDLSNKFGSIDKIEESEKMKMISYMSNNKGGIGILILSFIFVIFVFILSILSYILYIFIPVYIIYMIKVIVSVENL